MAASVIDVLDSSDDDEMAPRQGQASRPMSDLDGEPLTSSVTELDSSNDDDEYHKGDHDNTTTTPTTTTTKAPTQVVGVVFSWRIVYSCARVLL